MIRVTLEFGSQAELLAFFGSPGVVVGTPFADSSTAVRTSSSPKPKPEKEPPVPAADTPPAPASTPHTAATAPTVAPAPTVEQSAAAEVTPEMGSALIIKMIPDPAHKAIAAEVLAKHGVKGFKYLTTPAARAACYADLLAKARELGLVD